MLYHLNFKMVKIELEGLVTLYELEHATATPKLNVILKQEEQSSKLNNTNRKIAKYTIHIFI